jgi:predicted Holliday junction resolvase-like endonuclease
MISLFSFGLGIGAAVIMGLLVVLVVVMLKLQKRVKFLETNVEQAYRQIESFNRDMNDGLSRVEADVQRVEIEGQRKIDEVDRKLWGDAMRKAESYTDGRLDKLINTYELKVPDHSN